MTYFTYVFPCVWEDHCKVGFSKDPLARLEAFHARWFDVFDLERGFLIESDSQRDARDLELQLRGPFREHRAPMPSTVRKSAGGHTEWLRGAFAALERRSVEFEGMGYIVHRPIRLWVAARLLTRSDRLYSWSVMQWSAVQIAGLSASEIVASLRNTLDAFTALGIDVSPSLPEDVARWYFGSKQN